MGVFFPSQCLAGLLEGCGGKAWDVGTDVGIFTTHTTVKLIFSDRWPCCVVLDFVFSIKKPGAMRRDNFWFLR